MMEAVRAWEEAYTLEPSNLRAREFLRSALERIHAHMAPPAAPQLAAHPWLPPPATQQQVAADGARKPGGKLPPEPSPAPVQTRSTPQMPWDDGPSMALPQEAPTPGSTEEAGGAWSIHQEPLPDPPRRPASRRDHLAEPRPARRLRPRADRRNRQLRRSLRDLRPATPRHRPHPLPTPRGRRRRRRRQARRRQARRPPALSPAFPS